MKKVTIGISNIGSIYLRVKDGYLSIEDLNNDGAIECSIKDIKKAIRIIKDVYNNHSELSNIPYGSSGNTIHLGRYQISNGLKVFASNYIIISHMPDIIKMLKSVKVEKVKYILEQDSLLGLCLDELLYLKNTMNRRRKILVDDSCSKYIEV